MTSALVAPLERLAEQRMAQERLRSAIDAHYRALRRSVRRLGVPEYEVDDVLQEAFLVFNAKAALVQERAERAFLQQAAYRIVLTRQRGFARRREELQSEFEQFKQLCPTPEEEVSQAQSLEALDRILLEMPLELRMVFTLCEIEQIPIAEAAQWLELPLGTAYSRIRRAREIFKRLSARARAAFRGEAGR